MRTNFPAAPCAAVIMTIVAIVSAPAPAAGQSAAQPAPSASGAAPAVRPDGTRSARPVLKALRVARPPVVDGRLDDEVWRTAAVAADFVQLRPHAGEAATQRTEARVVYDEVAIYVAVRAWDSAPDSIASQLARRDADGLFSDWVDVIIDSYHDRRTAYRFAVNPHGVKRDIFHFDDGQMDTSWDAVWDVATSIDEHGWIAEFRIPLSQIRFAATDGEQTWGLQLGRTVARLDEVSYWSPLPPNAPGFVSAAGSLTGLYGLGSPRRLEVLPYVVASVTRAPAPATSLPSPFWRATDRGAAVGADMKYGLSSNLTLTGTVNPDFGQVEADPSVVNLSAFETFYPERRPFFLEGANLFGFGIGDEGSGEGLFYSRRIGRAPQRRTFAGADHVDVPESARILGAGKLTGRAGDWSVGVLNAVTQAEHASVSRGGVITAEPAEPLTNYAVARLSRDFRAGGSTLGVLATGMNRRLDDDAFAALRRAAYSAGVRGQHRFGADRDFQLNAFLAASAIYGDTLALQLAQRAPQRYYQRPDAAHVDYDPTRTSLYGMMGTASLARIGGGRWNGGVGGTFRTPGLDVNDVGFQQSADQRFVFGWFNYNSFEVGRVFRRWNVGFNPNSGWDFGGTRLWTQVNTWGNATFTNFWSVNFFLNNRWAAMSTGALRGGPAIYSPGGNAFSLNIASDRRRPVQVQLNGNGYREQETGALRHSVGSTLTLRPSPRFAASVQPGISRNRYAWQFVAAPATQQGGTTEYVFAELDQTTLSLTARLNATFSPTLSVQLYAQPFISAGDYDQFRRVVDPRARRFGERFHTFTGTELQRDATQPLYTARIGSDQVRFRDPDYSVRSLRSNAVVRWEYRPGSTLFLVWSHGRSGSDGDGTFDLRRGVDELLGAGGTNVVMVKLNYWLNL
jgi:hypothetical protein